MVILILRKCPQGLKGFVTRWLSEIATGVYLGALSARVRDMLWARVEQEVREGGAIMVYPGQTEQGFLVRTTGELPFTFEDFEGISLAKRPAVA